MIGRAKPKNRSFITVGIMALAISSVGAFILWNQEIALQWSSSNTGVFLAGLVLVTCIWIIFVSVKKAGSIINGYAIIWAAFCATYPLSAVAHLSGMVEYQRGFYDLAGLAMPPIYKNIYFALFLVTIAFISMWLGLNFGAEREKEAPPQLKIKKGLLLILGIIFIFLGIIGSLAIAMEAPSIIEGLFTMDRARETGGGLARFVFMSEWLNWGLVFLVVFVLQNNFIRSRNAFLCLVIFCFFLIILNMFWSGGRSPAIAAIFPFLFILKRITPHYSKDTVKPAILLIVIYIGAATLIRSGEIFGVSLWGKILEVLDWHMGRFAMIGLGFDMVERQGFMWGSTLVVSIVNVINAPSVLLKLPTIMDVPQSASSMIGEYLLGNPKINSIVPGAILDLYINFGIIAVAVGFFIVGFLAKKCIRVMEKTDSLGAFCVAAYIITILSTYFFALETSIWIYFLFTSGLPVICIYLCEIFMGANIINKLIFKK
jgi:oligosaccharide repeat unit polymerase